MNPPRARFVAILVVSLLVMTYVVGVVRLTQDSSRGARQTVPGELVIVQLPGTWDWLRSSDETVLAPLSVALRPQTHGYFIAVRPGKAYVQALYDPCPVTMAPPRCMAAAEIFAAEIDVWPAHG